MDDFSFLPSEEDLYGYQGYDYEDPLGLQEFVKKKKEEEANKNWLGHLMDQVNEYERQGTHETDPITGEVKEKGFTLVPSRYIEFVNRDENIDFDTKMKSLQGELKELLVQEEKSKSDLLAVFKELGYEIEL